MTDNELSKSGGYNRVWITTENEAKVYLTREDIYELGFLRSHPERKYYRHKDNKYLGLMQETKQNLGVKDFAEETTEIWDNTPGNITLLYRSTTPNKEDIQLVIDNYAG